MELKLTTDRKAHTKPKDGKLIFQKIEIYISIYILFFIIVIIIIIIIITIIIVIALHV